MRQSERDIESDEQLARRLQSEDTNAWSDEQLARRLQSEDTNAWWAPNVSGVPTVDMHPSEITANFGYHAATGLIFANAPLNCIAIGCELAKIRDDSQTDEERMRSRSRQVEQAATAARLESLESRRCRGLIKPYRPPSPHPRARGRREQAAAQGEAKKATNTGKESESAGRNASAGGERRSAPEAEKTVLMGAGSNENEETCAVCQVDFGEGESCLACKKCDSGFHVRCLNTWLLRAETCPCCRAKISAV